MRQVVQAGGDRVGAAEPEGQQQAADRGHHQIGRLLPSAVLATTPSMPSARVASASGASQASSRFGQRPGGVAAIRL
jgi:hypothetical protein